MLQVLGRSRATHEPTACSSQLTQYIQHISIINKVEQLLARTGKCCICDVLGENELEHFSKDHHSQTLTFHLSIPLGEPVPRNSVSRETWGGSISPAQKVLRAAA